MIRRLLAIKSAVQRFDHVQALIYEPHMPRALPHRGSRRCPVLFRATSLLMVTL
jgi:hypothetical protein